MTPETDKCHQNSGPNECILMQGPSTIRKRPDGGNSGMLADASIARHPNQRMPALHSSGRNELAGLLAAKTPVSARVPRRWRLVLERVAAK